MGPLIYLDNNATTRLAPEALEAMLPYLGEHYGNAGSAHLLGRISEAAVVHARDQLARLLGCQAAELVFTSGATESLNHAIRGVFEALPHRRHFVTTAVEHSAVLALGDWLKRQGVAVTVLGVDGDGRLDLGALEAAVGADTALVSIMAANNETGVRFPLEEAARIVKGRGALLHVDATQAVGKESLDLASLPVDLLSLSGHKFHGPKGVGALFLRRGLRIRPFMVGGNQERARRGGTENVPGIVGLGKAAELALGAPEQMARVRALREAFEAFLLERIPGVKIHGAGAPRLANTTLVSFQGLEAESLLLKLGDQGICAATGSACTTGQKEPSHVLRAMAVAAAEALGTVRFSMSRDTSAGELQRLTALLPGMVAELRAAGPMGRR